MTHTKMGESSQSGTRTHSRAGDCGGLPARQRVQPGYARALYRGLTRRGFEYAGRGYAGMMVFRRGAEHWYINNRLDIVYTDCCSF